MQVNQILMSSSNHFCELIRRHLQLARPIDRHDENTSLGRLGDTILTRLIDRAMERTWGTFMDLFLRLYLLMP